LALLLDIVKIYKRLRTSLIFHYTIKPTFYGTLAAAYLNIPSISVITGLGYTFLNKGLASAIARRLYKLALSKSTEVWFLNREDKAVFIRKKLVDPEKVYLLNGEGVNVQEFNPALFPKRPTEKITFCLIARLLYDKGVREYVEAARALKRTYSGLSVQLAGFLNVDNPSAVSRKELDTWVKEYGIEYLGPFDDVRPVIQYADCVVLPSYREGMSMILMESIAMGTPIIATDIPGCRELIEHGQTGFLCQARSSADLRVKMEQFIGLSLQERQQMGEKAREKAEKEFDQQKIVAVYLVRIKDMLDR